MGRKRARVLGEDAALGAKKTSKAPPTLVTETCSEGRSEEGPSDSDMRAVYAALKAVVSEEEFEEELNRVRALSDLDLASSMRNAAFQTTLLLLDVSRCLAKVAREGGPSSEAIKKMEEALSNAEAKAKSAEELVQLFKSLTEKAKDEKMKAEGQLAALQIEASSLRQKYDSATLERKKLEDRVAAEKKRRAALEARCKELEWEVKTAKEEAVKAYKESPEFKMAVAERALVEQKAGFELCQNFMRLFPKENILEVSFIDAFHRVEAAQNAEAASQVLPAAKAPTATIEADREHAPAPEDAPSSVA